MNQLLGFPNVMRPDSFKKIAQRLILPGYEWIIVPLIFNIGYLLRFLNRPFHNRTCVLNSYKVVLLYENKFKFTLHNIIVLVV